ncbi:hypothetical protein ANTRET_LOCUS9896 [Anthophora retusa]
MAEIMANQTHIILSEFDNLHSRLVNVSISTHKALYQATELAKSAKETEERLELENLIEDWMRELQTTVEEYRSYLFIMIDAILFAKQGLLHPAIISPRQLMTSAEKIRTATSYEFPLTPTELLSEQINGITHLKLSYSKGRAIVEVSIPLLSERPFTLFKIYPSPTTQTFQGKEFAVYVKPTTQFVAISADNQTYIQSVP